VSRPAWDWDLLDAHDQVVDRPVSPAFASRFDAESWLGESWRQLAEQGVAAARLAHHGEPVGPVVPLRTA
jgi:hypothetical protein